MLKAPLLAVALGLSQAPLTAEVVVQTVPETGQMTWSFETDGLGFQLIELNPDYVAAFYAGRGLPADVVEHMAGLCVFGTIVRNISDGSLSYRVTDWRYRPAGGEERPVTSKSQWVEKWSDMGTAFRWSLLPDDQTFAVGDWNQGFTVLELPHGSRFDLQIKWRQDDQPHNLTLKEVRCAHAPSP